MLIGTQPLKQSLQVGAKPRRVEKRVCGAVGPQSGFQRLQAHRVQHQLQHQRLVVVQRMRDQLRQPNGVQQAAGHTRRESITHVGHHRQADHQRVECRSAMLKAAPD